MNIEKPTEKDFLEWLEKHRQHALYIGFDFEKNAIYCRHCSFSRSVFPAPTEDSGNVGDTGPSSSGSWFE